MAIARSIFGDLPLQPKKFADFHEGDFLFFLAKGTERGRKREKGIVGYGIYHKSTQMKFEQMWRKYKTLNGYPSKKNTI